MFYVLLYDICLCSGPVIQWHVDIQGDDSNNSNDH